MNEELMAFIQTLPPEQREAAIAQAQGMAQSQGAPPMQQAPGMAPQQAPMPQPVDPRMGQPGMSNPNSQAAMPGTKDTFRDFAGEGDVVKDQQAQAKALRETATPEGLYTKNAGFVASNPLSHVATAVQRIRGNMNASEALEDKLQLSKDLGARDKADNEKEYTRKTKEKQLIQADIMRRNRRGQESINPLEQMANNEGKEIFL